MEKQRLAVWGAGLMIVLSGALRAAEQGEHDPPAWTKAHEEGPMTADQTRQFMKELARFVFDNHLKKDAKSPQRGMVYEYFDTSRKGQFDQFVQGEGLDTMHDGAWLGAAMVNAYHATGDEFYKQFLTEWQLPFYLKMLNHSDELFMATRNDARPEAAPWGKPWVFQKGEKGFVPYFWDDGGSVSLERRHDKNPRGIRPCADHLAGKPNPKFLLDGYSQGMSNHMAQDLGVMVQLAWLLLRESDDPADRKLASEVAEAAGNLHECRVRHFGRIPMCVAPAALAAGDAELMKHVPTPDDPKYWTPDNAYVRALYTFAPGQRLSTSGFADDQQYRYYYGIAHSGGRVPEPLAFKTIYDAYTAPLLYRYYSDDEDVPPGINRFDLHPIYCRDGKLEDYRSDRKGPYGGPKPIGSRMGSQNMVCCGWALQMLRAYPGIWEKRYRSEFPNDARVYLEDPLPDQSRPSLDGLTAFPEAGVSLRAYREVLIILGSYDSASVKLCSRPNGKGSHATITVDKQEIGIVNDRGEKLSNEAFDWSDSREREKESFFCTAVGYTAFKDQKPWLNGIEQGRYSIVAGKSVRNFYLASRESQVKARLEYELGVGLRTWQAIFREKGYIPTGIGTGSQWHHISDSGGYAHLISACAQWLFYLEGKRDWELHRIPKVEAETP